MCTKVVERLLDFNHEIKQLYSIDLEEDLRYINSDLGITANGFIYVIGKYHDGIDNKEFEELLEVDILAPYDKLEDHNDFKVVINDYDYHILHGDLLLEITLHIHGLSDHRVKQKTEFNDLFDEMEEKTIIEERIKTENIESIEEKIDDYDSEELTAEKLTTIIQKVIHEDTGHVMQLSDEPVIDMFDISEHIPLVEDIVHDEFIDHIEQRYDSDIEIVDDVLEDILIDHITGIREVVNIPLEAPERFIDHFIEEKEKKEERTCQLIDRFDDVDLADIHPMYQKTYDHLVLYADPEVEYDYQHQLCKESKEVKNKEFDLPLFDNSIDLLDVIPMKGEFYMFKEEKDDMSLEKQLEKEYELDDFMKALDLFEEEIYEYIEPEEIIEEKHMSSMISEVTNEDSKIVKVMKQEEVNDHILEDIFDDTFNAMSKMRYVIVRKGDTYASIAKRYNIEEHVLAKANNYMVLESRCVIEIPIR